MILTLEMGVSSRTSPRSSTRPALTSYWCVKRSKPETLHWRRYDERQTLQHYSAARQGTLAAGMGARVEVLEEFPDGPQQGHVYLMRQYLHVRVTDHTPERIGTRVQRQEGIS